MLAGISIGSLRALFGILHYHSHSPPDDVDDREHHDPHAVYEVPIKSNYAKTFTLPRVDPTEQREDESCA